MTIEIDRSSRPTVFDTPVPSLAATNPAKANAAQAPAKRNKGHHRAQLPQPYPATLKPTRDVTSSPPSHREIDALPG